MMKATRIVCAGALALVCVIVVGVRHAAGQSPAQLIEQATRATDAERYDEAIALYSKALKADPRNVEAWKGRTLARVRHNDFAGAVDDATALLALQPNSVPGLSYRCVARAALNDFSGALGDCNRSLELDPKNWGTYDIRGAIRMELKDLAGAIADFTSSLAINPGFAEALHNRGMAKDGTGDLAGALEDYQQALTIEPTNQEYRADVDSVKKRVKPPVARSLPAPVPAPAPAPATAPAPLAAPPALPMPPPLPLPPPVPGASQAPAPIRVAAGPAAPKVTKHVDPVYPAAALKARIQGIVTLDATIAPGGTVIDAAVVTSIPQLDQAALDAVRQWVYEPTRQPGPIVLTVTVTFALK